MDLVEIRKKAKNKKKKPAKKKAPVVEEAVDQQQELEEPVQVEPPVESEPQQQPAEADAGAAAAEVDAPVEKEVVPPAAEEPGQQVPEQDDDPLDALFSFHQEGVVAETENYLQALVAEEDVVDSNIEQWLTFSLSDEEYALSIESVSEIIKPREVTDIPRVPEFIRGIISLRGIIVPVFDLNKRLNLGSAEVSSSSRIIVCNDGDRLAGFMVDSINQVVNVPIDNIEPPPTVLSGLDRDFVEGVGRVDGRMLILLHLSNVINAELV